MLENTEIDTEKELKCFHCGNPCSSQIAEDDKYFCCNGCKTVFGILSQSGLEDYYRYESNPGITMNATGDETYDFLDNPDIADSLMDFKSDHLNKITLFIPTIHCSSCIWLLENLHYLHPSVKESRVNFLKKQVSIGYDPSQLGLRQLADIMDSVGYGPLINWDSTGTGRKKKGLRPVTIKLGVAGFCFGNVMLLSFPEYFGFEITDAGFKNFFSYLNLLLALPVLLYSGTDYLRSAIAGLRSRFINIDVPIALGIITLFGRSAYEVITQTGPGFFDSFTGLIFFLLIGRWFQDKSYEHLSFERDFKSYFPLAVRRINGDNISPVPVQDLRNGDIIKIRNNEIIPADCILVSESTDIDYSFVTGEQLPIGMRKGDIIYAGGRQKGGEIVLEVAKPVDQSYLTGLWNQSGGNEKLRSQRMIDKVAKYFTLIVLAVAVITGLYWGLTEPSVVWETITAVLIVACPCALALSIPFTYGNIVRVTGRNHLYLRSSEVVEKFNSVDQILFDKTGTLTHSDKGDVEYKGPGYTGEEKTVLRTMTGSSFHPLSQKINFHLDHSGPLAELDSFEEIPGAGIRVTSNGTEYRLGSKTFAGVDNESGEGVYFSVRGEYKGRFLVRSHYRKELKDVVQDLGRVYKLGVISGDRPTDETYLREQFPAGSVLAFEMKPDQKQGLVRKLKEDGNRIMMLGDGLNDAAALGESDVGVAVTDDISAFSPSCDAIFDASNFHILHRLIRFIRLARPIVIGSFIISFLYNTIGLGFAVSGALTPVYAAILMPLSSITILAFTTVSVNIAARSKGLK